VTSPSLERGLAALRDGDPAAARRAFEAAVAVSETGAALEGLAEALYLEREYSASADQYMRAFAAYRKDADRMAAGRAARSAAWITGNVFGDWAVQSGWFARARTILEEAGDDRPERGWVLIIRSLSEPDPQLREAILRDAIAVGRRFGDPDIEFEALGYLGGHYVMIGRVEEGLVFLDEALAAACAGEMTEVTTVDGLFCGFFWACELVNDVPRADQWMRAASDLMNRRNVVAAFCRAHYGGILTAAGRWEEAETELLAASSRFERGVSTRREAALIRLGNLRVRQGRLEEATQLLTGLEAHPDAVRALAGLYFARGEAARARDVLERATAGPDDAVPQVGESTMVGPLLALLVDVHLAEGSIDAAAQAAVRLDRIAHAQGGAYLRAAAALAEGQVCIGSGRGDARACLHDALEGFAQAQLPLELASTRLAMARSLAESSPDVAIAEAKSALEGFERLEAARHADAAAQILRSLGAPARTGPKGVGALTKRESEVLKLVGAGLSNPEIADRLYITRKTVEHHVARVLAKLGLRNRAEAAAFAAREKIRP
jgi:DNA-binding CsgD family transcriptional regulator